MFGLTDRVATLVGVAIVLGAAACAAAPADPARATAAVRASLAGQGLEVASVDCPPRATSTGAMVCHATVEGVVLRLEVRTDASSAELRVRPLDPVVVVSTLTSEIEHAVAEQGLAVAAIECKAAVWRVSAGAVHRCRVTETGGRHWVYEATFAGRELEHDARLLPEADSQDIPSVAVEGGG